MPSPFTNRVLALLGVQVALFAGTSGWAYLGTEAWHHLASLGVVLLGVVLYRRPLTRSRAVLALGVLATSVLALVSGFWLLYWKEGIRIAGYQDWGVWWHVFWSWAALVFFVQHTWVNRVAFLHYVRWSLATARATLAHLGAYALLVVAFLVTWSDLGKGWFDVESYIPFSLYTWIAVVLPPYVAWSMWTLRQRRRTTAAADRPRGAGPTRRSVDLALVPTATLAVISGVVLTFFDDAMEANGWKYVSKFWHVWPSTLFTLLVFVHSVQLWGAVRAHWRRLDERVGTGGERADGPS